MTEIDYRAVRRRVKLRLVNRVLFFVHLFFFFAGVTAPNSGGLAVIWLPLLIGHFIWAFNFNLFARLVDRQTEREIERLRARGYVVKPPEYVTPPAVREKPKRAARLTDDGEIEYEEEDEAFEDVPVRRSRAHE
jgi:hypothetical protein